MFLGYALAKSPVGLSTSSRVYCSHNVTSMGQWINLDQRLFPLIAFSTEHSQCVNTRLFEHIMHALQETFASNKQKAMSGKQPLRMFSTCVFFACRRWPAKNHKLKPFSIWLITSSLLFFNCHRRPAKNNTSYLLHYFPYATLSRFPLKLVAN